MADKEPSILNLTVRRELWKLIDAARDTQRARAAAFDDNTHRLMGVKVPQWLHAALKEVLGHEPLYLGQPITVGEHEEIRIEWWDPRFPEDVGAPVQRAPFSAM